MVAINLSFANYSKYSLLLTLLTMLLMMLCFMPYFVRPEKPKKRPVLEDMSGAEGDISCSKIFKPTGYVIKSISARGHRLYIVYGQANDSTSILIVRAKVRYFFDKPLFHLDLSRFARVSLLETKFRRHTDVLRDGWLTQFIYLRKKRILVSIKPKSEKSDVSRNRFRREVAVNVSERKIEKFQCVDCVTSDMESRKDETSAEKEEIGKDLKYYVYMENQDKFLQYAQSETWLPGYDYLLLYHFTTLSSYPAIRNNLNMNQRYHDYYEFNDDDDDDDSKDPNTDLDGKLHSTYLTNYISVNNNLAEVIFADGEIQMGNRRFNFDPYKYKVLYFGFNLKETQLLVATKRSLFDDLKPDYIPFERLVDHHHWRVFLHFDHVYIMTGKEENNTVFFFRDFMISQNLGKIHDDKVLRLPLGRMALSDFFDCPVDDGKPGGLDSPPPFPAVGLGGEGLNTAFLAVIVVMILLLIVVIGLLVKMFVL